MAYFRTTVSYGSTGSKSVNVGFTPVGARITLGSRFGTTDSYVHKSEGFTNGSSCYCHSIFQDSTGSQTVSGLNKLVNHFERVSGTVTPVVVADTPSFSGTNLQFNVTTANANYQFHIEAWD